MKQEIFLKERERRLVELLRRFRVASVEDIRELAYNGIGKNHVHAELKKLVSVGIIEKIPFQRGNRRWFSLYSLTGKAYRRFVLGETAPDYRKQYRSDNPDHDLTILAIYKRIKASPGKADFISENFLYSGSAVVKSLGLEDWTRNHPDGLIVDETKSGTHYVPLECELSLKTGFRYEAKLADYYRSDRIPAVIYICKDAGIRDTLRRIEKKYCDIYAPKIFYGLLDEVLSSKGRMVFQDRNGGKLSI